MRQGAEQSAPTSFPCTTTCMIMLIIVTVFNFLIIVHLNRGWTLIIRVFFLVRVRMFDAVDMPLEKFLP